MGEVIIKMKVMPEGTETDIDNLLDKCKKAADNQEAKIHDQEVQPVAFGLKALILLMTIDEDRGISDLEEEIEGIDKVSTIEVLDVRRAVG